MATTTTMARHLLLFLFLVLALLSPDCCYGSPSSSPSSSNATSAIISENFNAVEGGDCKLFGNFLCANCKVDECASKCLTKDCDGFAYHWRTRTCVERVYRHCQFGRFLQRSNTTYYRRKRVPWPEQVDEYHLEVTNNCKKQTKFLRGCVDCSLHSCAQLCNSYSRDADIEQGGEPCIGFTYIYSVKRCYPKHGACRNSPFFPADDDVRFYLRGKALPPIDYKPSTSHDERIDPPEHRGAIVQEDVIKQEQNPRRKKVKFVSNDVNWSSEPIGANVDNNFSVIADDVTTTTRSPESKPTDCYCNDLLLKLFSFACVNSGLTTPATTTAMATSVGSTTKPWVVSTRPTRPLPRRTTTTTTTTTTTRTTTAPSTTTSTSSTTDYDWWTTGSTSSTGSTVGGVLMRKTTTRRPRLPSSPNVVDVTTKPPPDLVDQPTSHRPVEPLGTPKPTTKPPPSTTVIIDIWSTRRRPSRRPSTRFTQWPPGVPTDEFETLPPFTFPTTRPTEPTTLFTDDPWSFAFTTPRPPSSRSNQTSTPRQDVTDATDFPPPVTTDEMASSAGTAKPWPLPARSTATLPAGSRRTLPRRTTTTTIPEVDAGNEPTTTLMMTTTLEPTWETSGILDKTVTDEDGNVVEPPGPGVRLSSPRPTTRRWPLPPVHGTQTIRHRTTTTRQRTPVVGRFTQWPPGVPTDDFDNIIDPTPPSTDEPPVVTTRKPGENSWWSLPTRQTPRDDSETPTSTSSTTTLQYSRVLKITWYLYDGDCMGSELREMGECCMCTVDECKYQCQAVENCAGFSFTRTNFGWCTFKDKACSQPGTRNETTKFFKKILTPWEPEAIRYH